MSYCHNAQRPKKHSFGKRKVSKETVSVIALCIILCGVYFIAVTLGDNYGKSISESQKSAAAVAAISNFVEKNDKLAAFIGLKAPSKTDDFTEDVYNFESGLSISEKANLYIEYCNAIYNESRISGE